MALSTIDTSSISGLGYGFKNRIINGGMVVDQRNAGASVTPVADQYVLDRFNYYLSQGSKFTAQQNAGSVTPPAGFKYYMGLTVGASANVTVGAGDYFGTRQFIEGYNVADLGWGAAGASTVTLSFWVRCSLTGTMGGAVCNSGAARSYPFTYTVNAANTWEYKTVVIPGDTTGTWLSTNGIGMEVRLSLGGGSSFASAAGVWAAGNFVTATGATNIIATNSATFYITGVQLEAGTVATSFDWRSYGTELMLCQRYYFRMKLSVGSADPFGMAFMDTAGQAQGLTQFPVPMRTYPTSMETSGTATDYRIRYAGSNSSACSTVPGYYSATVTNGAFVFNMSGGLTVGQAVMCQGNTANAYLGWSAEL